MDVTTMLSTASLIKKLKTAYPQFRFNESSDYLWSPSEQAVYFADNKDNNYEYILHELSHGLLAHADYNYDVELVAMERAAWDKAIELAKDYNLVIKEDLVESNLDSYRDWLHARSTCPNCKATGLQTKKQTYTCPACTHKWRVNEARVCALRRFSIN